MTPLRVAGVVVTHNRCSVLAETLRAARAQSTPPERVYVIDNASDDDTTELLCAEFPDVIQIRPEENLVAGARALGIEAAWSDGFDAFWLVDDDSSPVPDALETLLAAAKRMSEPVGIVGCNGGVVRFGLIRHVKDPHVIKRCQVAENLFAVDFVLLDGSLVLRRTVDAIGVPRADYFIMMEDVEYPLRARRAGLDVLTVDRDLMRRRHLGSRPGSALWRSYYQSRNHVRMALDFRSPALFFGCMVRQAHFLLAAVRAPNRRWERVRLLGRGVWDGVRGRMGRRIEPERAVF
jgi:rhamnopyranosyl-N-acetylglucosaminyl-diphospho-decaprenol beta-1,3/1,4-galactofuranosyltransferase